VGEETKKESKRGNNNTYDMDMMYSSEVMTQILLYITIWDRVVLSGKWGSIVVVIRLRPAAVSTTTTLRIKCTEEADKLQSQWKSRSVQ
jgi:hypothetical protein